MNEGGRLTAAVAGGALLLGLLAGGCAPSPPPPGPAADAARERADLAATADALLATRGSSPPPTATPPATATTRPGEPAATLAPAASPTSLAPAQPTASGAAPAREAVAALRQDPAILGRAYWERILAGDPEGAYRLYLPDSPPNTLDEVRKLAEALKGCAEGAVEFAAPRSEVTGTAAVVTFRRPCGDKGVLVRGRRGERFSICQIRLENQQSAWQLIGRNNCN